MKKIFFIYDSLMTNRMQDLLGIPIEFLSYGYTHGRLFFLNDGKRRRNFFIKSNGKCVYGAIFVIKDYEAYETALYSFYASTKKYTNIISPLDLYARTTIKVTPISFSSLKEFETSSFKRYEPIECNCFCGNLLNQKVKHSIDKSAYYRKYNGLDVVSFLQLVKE